MSSLLLLPPLALDVLLFLLFAKGLRPGKTALLTALATQARGHALDTRTTHYTRRLSMLWAGVAAFFALMIVAGLILAEWRSVASIAAFSQGLFYAALLVGEHFFRRHHLDHLDHMGFFDFLRFLRRVDYMAALRD